MKDEVFHSNREWKTLKSRARRAQITKGNRLSNDSFHNDKRLEIFRLQGVYLYDKGENDELFYVRRFPQPIYKYILPYFFKKVNNANKKF